ncbi:hypothetical protein BK668_29265 [Pseudomonas fluorescens]|nr:hypothetical protein BK668_29265 [Pseudomonas fluorescens]
MLTQEFGVFNKNRLFARHCAKDRRHTGIVAITHSDGLTFFKINAAEVLDKRRDKMLARLLAVTDDIDACLLLVVQGQSQGISFALNQFLILQCPG